MANVEVGKAYLQIVPSTKGIHKQVSSDLNGSMGAVGQSAGMKLGGAMTKALAAVGIGAAIGKAVKSGLEEGAALEQSLGGVEAIFGDSADAVKKYAAESWQSVGISANEYMENVTSFSAALINSMGKDTDAAAEVANQALIDMGDNANRFGTDMASIQAAYQGFAKQNYTMLDNLKLGYGGTKTEMERLLKDAQAISGIEYNIDNLGDVYSAIHVIQEELNVTGTTAKEGAATLAGSTAAMAAAWKNLLGNMAIGEDISEPIKNLALSISNYLSNLVPMVLNLVSQLPGAIATLVSTLVPQLMQTGGEAMRSIADGLVTGIPDLVTRVTTGLDGFVDMLVDNLDGFLETGGLILKNLLKGLEAALPKIVDMGGKILKKLWEGVKKVFSWLQRNWKTILKQLWDVFTSVDWIGLGKTLIEKIWSGIKFLFSKIPGVLKSIATTAWDWFKNVDWIGLGKKAIGLIVDGLKALVTSIPTTLKNIATTAWDWFKNVDWLGLGKAVISAIVSGLGAIVSGALSIPGKLLDIGKSAWDGVKNIDWGGLGSKVVGGIRDGIGKVGSWLKDKLTGVTTDAKTAAEGIDFTSVGQGMVNQVADGITLDKISDKFNQALTKAKNGASAVNFKGIGEDMANGVIKGLDSKFPAVKQKAEDLAWQAQKAMINVARISSPSKLFRDTVGKFMALGVAQGLEDYAPVVYNAAEDLVNNSINGAIPETALRLGNGTLNTAINGGVAEPQYVVVVNAEMDGTPIKTEVSNYTINKISSEQRYLLRAQGI